MIDRRVAVAQLTRLVVAPRDHRAVGFERNAERVARADGAHVVEPLHAYRRLLIGLGTVT